jgi:hypothetical protein
MDVELDAIPGGSEDTAALVSLLGQQLLSTSGLYFSERQLLLAGQAARSRRHGSSLASHPAM